VAVARGELRADARGAGRRRAGKGRVFPRVDERRVDVGRRRRHDDRLSNRFGSSRSGHAIPLANAATSAALTETLTTAGFGPPLAARSGPTPRAPPDADTCAV